MYIFQEREGEKIDYMWCSCMKGRTKESERECKLFVFIYERERVEHVLNKSKREREMSMF